MCKKFDFSIFWLTAHLAYKIDPLKIYTEWSNLNTVKISFCKVAVPLIKFAIKDVKMSKKRLPYPYLTPYNTREEDLRRRTSVVHESRNVRHTKSAMPPYFCNWFFVDVQGRFGRFTNLSLFGRQISWTCLLIMQIWSAHGVLVWEVKINYSAE